MVSLSRDFLALDNLDIFDFLDKRVNPFGKVQEELRRKVVIDE